MSPAILPVDSITVEDDTPELEKLPDATEPAPDGGYGWVVVGVAFLINVAGYGYIFTWGVFQQYFHANVFTSKNDLTTLSFTGSTFNFLIVTTGLFLRIPYLYLGIRGVMAVGSVIMLVGWLLASFATQPWQLLLTLGVLLGIGAGFLNNAYIVLLGQYFTKRRAIALGITTCGGGIAGFVFAPLTRLMLDKLGSPWTLRVFCGLYAVMCAFIVVFGKERVSIKGMLRQQMVKIEARASAQPNPFLRVVNQLFNMAIVKKTEIRVFMVMSLMCMFAYPVPFYFLPTYTVFIGNTASDGALAAGIVSGTSLLGRLLFGLLTNRLGSINMFLASSAMAALTLLLWPLVTNFAGIVVFSVSYGFASGGWISMYLIVMMECSTLEDLSDTVAIVQSSGSLGMLLGPFVFAALLNGSGGTSYVASQLFSGIVFSIGTASIVVLFLIQCKQV